MKTNAIMRAWLHAAGLVAFVALALTFPAGAAEQFVNKGSSTLSSAITTTNGTSISVADASTFPTGGNFRILVDSEYMLVTGVSGSTFTVTRGAESSAGATHASGAAVRCILTAGALGALQTDTLSSAALSASGLYVPLAGNPAVLKSLALDPSTTAAYASQGVFRSYFNQGWYSRNSANTGETLVIGTNGANSVLIGSGSGTGASASVYLLGTATIETQPAGTTRFLVDTSGVTINAAAGSYGGGAQVMFLGNRTTAPSSNPTAGGILYAEAGELLYRSSVGNTNQVSGLRYGTYANRPTVSVQGAQYFPTDGHTPWVSDTVGTWHPVVGGTVGTAPPAAATFTAVNQGAGTIGDSSGGLKVVGVNDSAITTLRAWVASATSGVEAGLVAQPPGSQAAATFSVQCVCLRESATGKVASVCITVAHATQVTDLEYQHWQISNTTRDTSTSYAMPGDYAAPIFLKLVKSGANILAQYSRTRVDWTTLNTVAVTAAFTTAFDQAGLMSMGLNIAPTFYVLHYSAS